MSPLLSRDRWRRGSSRVFARIGLALLFLATSRGLCIDKSAFSDYVAAAQETYLSKIKSLKAEMSIDYTDRFSPPAQVTVQTGGGQIDLAAESVLSRFRYACFLHDKKVRYDRNQIERIVTTPDGKSYADLYRPVDVRSAYDGSYLRTVTLGLPFSNTITTIDSPRDVYPTIIDSFSNVFTQYTIPPHGTWVAEEATVERIQGKDEVLFKISCLTPLGCRQDVWIDPQREYRPVRREVWAKEEDSGKWFLNVEVRVDYRLVDSVWLPVRLEELTWLPAQSPGAKPFLRNSVVVTVDPKSIALRSLDDDLFTFTGMGIDRRGKVTDLKTGVSFSYSPSVEMEMPLDSIVAAEGMKPADEKDSRFDSELVRIPRSAEDDLDIKAQKGLPPRSASLSSATRRSTKWIVGCAVLAISSFSLWRFRKRLFGSNRRS